MSHEESTCHYYTSLHSIEQVKMERVQADRQQQFSRTMPDGTMVNSYVELYEAKLKQQVGLGLGSFLPLHPPLPLALPLPLPLVNP